MQCQLSGVTLLYYIILFDHSILLLYAVYYY